MQNKKKHEVKKPNGILCHLIAERLTGAPMPVCPLPYAVLQQEHITDKRGDIIVVHYLLWELGGGNWQRQEILPSRQDDAAELMAECND